MVALKRFGPDVGRTPFAYTSLGFGQAADPYDVLGIGQDQFLPSARGIVWDCRGFQQGLPAVPMDFNAHVSSDLSSLYFQDASETWPDQ